MLQADLSEVLPEQPPLRVLDIAPGHMALWLAERGHTVTLAEPAAPMLDGARERFAQAGQTATFIQSLAGPDGAAAATFRSGSLSRGAGVVG